METYTKQIGTWSQINMDVSENMKYQDLIESLKTNKEVKNLPKFVSEHVLTVLKEVDDQTTERVLDILKIKYGRSRMEKVEECVMNRIYFKESEYNEEDKFLLAMEELDLREGVRYFTLGMEVSLDAAEDKKEEECEDVSVSST